MNIAKRSLLFILLFPCLCRADDPDPAPPRVFFSDANLSVGFLNHWDVDPSFPYGPLFHKITQQGSSAYVQCQVSKPQESDHMASDASYDLLRGFAQQDIASRQPNARVLANAERQLLARHAFEITWEDASSDPATQVQTEYFFNANRVYSLTLQARADSFPWLVPDFQEWLTTLRVLSHRNAGQLDSPAHGGIWIQQMGGAKITVPEEWLIGVANDQILGATLAEGDAHTEWTVTVDLTAPGEELTPDERKEARDTLEKKGYKVSGESDEPFHGLPAYRLAYEGTLGGRFVKGQDLWVAGTKARWLFNIEGDGPMFNRLGDEYRTMLNNVQFL